MTKRVLVVEPYEALAAMLKLALEEFGYRVEFASFGEVDRCQFDGSRYECMFINLDQSPAHETDAGLHLAEVASQAGVPVIMISDNRVASEVISENGWIQVNKPFTLATLQDALLQATRRASESGASDVQNKNLHPSPVS